MLAACPQELLLIGKVLVLLVVSLKIYFCELTKLHLQSCCCHQKGIL